MERKGIIRRKHLTRRSKREGKGRKGESIHAAGKSGREERGKGKTGEQESERACLSIFIFMSRVFIMLE